MKNSSIILALAILLVFSGCHADAAADTLTGKIVKHGNSESEIIRIGFIGPLSGNLASLGTSQRNALLIALDEINTQGINGKKVEIIFEDSKSSPQEAATVAHKLINSDKILAIIGPLSSSPTMAIAPIAEQNKVPLISPIATSPVVRYAGDYIFRTMPDVNLQTKDLAQFAADSNLKKVGIIYVNNDFGAGATESFTSYFEEMGGEISLTQNHDWAVTDFRAQLTKIKSANVDALFLASYPKESGLIIKQARELNFDKQIFGVETLAQKEVTDITGNYADGVVYATPKKMTSKEFEKRYQARFHDESRFGADTAYDAFMLIIESIKQCGEEGEKIKDCLYKIGQNYQGASGPITFDEYGDVNKPFELFRIENGTGIKIK